MSLTVKVLIALVAGLVAGILIDPSRSPILAGLVTAADTVGTIWVNAIRMTVVPLVVSLLITGVASAADPRLIRTVGLSAFATFLGLLSLSAVFAFLVLPWLFTWLRIDPATSAVLRESAASSTVATGDVPTFTQFLTSIIPVNPVKAAADGAMLPLVVFSLAFALAMLALPEASRARLLAFFKAIGEAMLVIVRWVISLAPIGVFALMFPVATRTGTATAGALTYYMVAMAVACTLLIALLYPVVALVARVPIARFARAVFPAQAVAVSSSSSLASLPALLDGAERRLGLPQTVSGVTLPLAVSMFKITSPVVWSVAALFLAQLYGIPLSLTDRLVVIATAALSSFSVPGIPHGWLLILSQLLITINVPVEGVALLWAVDAVPDIFATTANVTGDMAAAAIVGRRAALVPVQESVSVAEAAPQVE
jgi:proton glutamate symport protein